MNKPRVRPLPKTGDADLYRVTFPDGWSEVVAVSNLEQSLFGPANQAARSISRLIHNVQRWTAREQQA